MSSVTRIPYYFILLIPLFMILGGTILILSLLGKEIGIPIPDAVVVWISAIGSVIGGVYIIYTRIKYRTMRAIL